MTESPNKPDAVNPAIASRFAVVHHWRGVTDPERFDLKAHQIMSLRRSIWISSGAGAIMTIFMSLIAIDSVVQPMLFLPIALLPFAALLILASKCTGKTVLTITTIASLVVFAVGFRIYADGIFVSRTTLHAGLFLFTPLIQIMIIAGFSIPALLLGRRIDRWTEKKNIEQVGLLNAGSAPLHPHQ